MTSSWSLTTYGTHGKTTRPVSDEEAASLLVQYRNVATLYDARLLVRQPPNARRYDLRETPSLPRATLNPPITTSPTTDPQVKLQVPHDFPLTHQKHGTEVVVVTDMNHECAGVYPDFQRALLYIQNWLATDQNWATTTPQAPHVRLFPSPDGQTAVVGLPHMDDPTDCAEPLYLLQKTCLRL